MLVSLTRGKTPENMKRKWNNAKCNKNIFSHWARVLDFSRVFLAFFLRFPPCFGYQHVGIIRARKNVRKIHNTSETMHNVIRPQMRLILISKTYYSYAIQII